MDDAGGNLRVIDVAQFPFGLPQERQQLRQRQLERVVMHLQGADAGGEIEHAGQGAGAQPLVQYLNPKAQSDIQHRRTVLDQQTGVAGQAVDHVHRMFAGRGSFQDGGIRLDPRHVHRDRLQGFDQTSLRLQQPHRRIQGDRDEAHPVARSQLPQFPQVRLDHRGRAHEAAQTGTVGAENHRHVAGEIHRADGIGVVVDVGGMQAGLAAVGPRPARAGADQPYPGAAGVVMHLPGGGEEGRDVVFGKEIRRPVRAVDHPQLPFRLVAGNQAGIERLLAALRRGGSNGQHVAQPQRPPAVAAEATQREGGAAAQVVGNRDAVLDAQVSPRAGSGLPDLQDRATRHGERRPEANGIAVESGRHRRPGQRDHRRTMEAQGWPVHGEFQPRRAGRIADQAVAQTEREIVHRPRGRHAHVPVTQASRPVLHRGQRAGGHHFDHRRPVLEFAQGAGGVPAGAERRVAIHDRPQISQVALDAADPGFPQGAAERGQRLFPILAPDDDFCQQRVVVGRHLDPGLNPGIAARPVRERHFGQQAGLRLELAGRVLGVQPRLDGMAARRDREGVQRRQIARRQPHHPLHQIDSGDLFGDAVFDLQAGVHFQKVKLAAGGIDDKFHRARRAVSNRPHQPHGGPVQRLAHGVEQVGRRSFLDHLLVAALQGTVAFAQGDHLAPPVAEYLHLDVPSLFDEFFQEHPGVAEVTSPQMLHRGKGPFQGLGVAAQSHPDTAAARGAFQHHRVTDALRRRQRFHDGFQQLGARQQRRLVGARQFPGGVLEAEAFDLGWSGANESQSLLFAGQGEGGVFAEKTVTGMNGLRAAGAGGVENALDVQIGFGGDSLADPERGIGLQDVAGTVIGAGVHRDRPDAEPLQGADDPAGDGAAIGD